MNKTPVLSLCNLLKDYKKDQGSQEISNLTDVLSWYRGLFISVDWLGYTDISKLLVKIK